MDPRRRISGSFVRFCTSHSHSLSATWKGFYQHTHIAVGMEVDWRIDWWSKGSMGSVSGGSAASNHLTLIIRAQQRVAWVAFELHSHMTNGNILHAMIVIFFLATDRIQEPSGLSSLHTYSITKSSSWLLINVERRRKRGKDSSEWHIIRTTLRKKKKKIVKVCTRHSSRVSTENKQDAVRQRCIG